ncbi:MAG: DEAD/DEAH box helicase family protein [Lachnospiraceae bacterium]|nr:DEAD/DEAH box helicase family protein [Lachnospiraceae bacterium]
MKIKNVAVSQFWKGEAAIRGTAEDGGCEYQVQLFLTEGSVRDSVCSCRKGNSDKVMCPHGQALWKAYQKENSGQEQKGKGSVMVYTSPEVRAMIREYTNREVAQIQTEGQRAQITLAPKLMISSGGREIKAEFWLVFGRRIRIKDLAAFAQAVNQGAYAEYGKNFAFHHNLDAFTPQCRPLVEFAAEIANTYQEYYSQFRRSSFETRQPLGELSLNRENRDRFFAIMDNQVLEVQIGFREKRMLLVCRKNPRFYISVQRRGETGLCVSLKGNNTIFFGERNLYVGDEERIYGCDETCSRILSVFMDQISRSHCQVTVNEKDIPLFYERVLKKIEPYCIFEGDEINWQDYQPKPLKAEFRFDCGGFNQIEMEPVLSYGDYSFHPVEDENLPRTVCRDVPGEFRVSQLIAKYFQYKDPSEKKLLIREQDEMIFRLLESGIGEFARLGTVMVSERLKKWKILPPVKVKANVSMNQGWLDIQVDMEGLNGSDFNGILESYQQKRSFYRLKTGEFLKLDDDGLLAVARLGRGLSLSGKELLGKGVRLPGYRALYLDSLLKEGPGITFYRDQMFKAMVRGMKSVEDSDFSVPAALQNVLRGYQKIGYRWLRTLDAYGFGGILADDMGLGKTLQVISLFSDEYQKEGEPSIIICPASLVYNWENEFRKFAPWLNVFTIAGSSAQREQVFRLLAEPDKGQDCQIIITSYELLKRDMEHYENMSFRFQVIDEAQYIKNASTQSAKAVKGIRAKTRFALTGTPVENRLSELWSIFDYLMPGFLFTYPKFKKSYEIPIAKEQDKESLSHLRRLIGPFILRRLKKDVLKELPEKLEMEVYSKFEGKQRELYAANAARLKNRLEQLHETAYCSDKLQILAELTRLRQICCDPSLCYENYKGGSAKLETCIDLVKNGIQGGHKILLFSQFAAMLDVIGKRLFTEGIDYYLLTGKTPKEDRLKMADSFHSDEVPVFLISLKAGGTGLNLTAADLVIHYDPWWNEAAQNQATDRAHRIGQEKQVTVFRLITKGTIEERIRILQKSKRSLAEQVITEGTLDFASLKKEDIVKMLMPESG